jgi:hypothetical protein
MAQPTLDHPVLGRLTYEDAHNWWAGQVELRPGTWIDFSLSTWTGTAPTVEIEELLRRGVDFLMWARQIEPAVQARIADELFGTYNEAWASEEVGGQGQMSREQFQKHIEPNSIDFHADGSAYWYFSDGDLFAGHWIEIRISAGREITEVCLAG